MSSDSQQAAQNVIRHLYYLNPEPIRYRNALHDIEMWIIAHEYEVASLITTSEVTIADQLESLTPLKGISHFTDVLRAIYKAPELGGELRKIAVQACKDEIEHLISQHKFRKMLMEVPEMAVDLLNEMAKPQQERGRLMRVQRSIS
ncbi:uncharacterized protein RCC_09692 [Ramularia collo-cygni]|uniref:Uncharacterized protein n=1 Tax=Ramularia collo-cygni TaxID=112498 RepID=A0A2D3V3M1_9PEZI|nr:uncharacterized protein RCC_09692 [Ramularia collo-cygni]CZT23976.1 uncharacterized protein RCC_09692 [Ramularia collo-cygni]